MSDKPSRAGKPHNRTDTLIGAGMRIAGNIGFSGTLRIQGDVLGDVTSDGAQNAAVVVDASGSLTGRLAAPFVHVRGRVIGPVQAAESIDVYRDATVVGDASYGQLDIQEGGIVEGLLTPLSPEGRSGPATKPPLAAVVEPDEGDAPMAWSALGQSVGERLAQWGWRRLLGAFLVLGAVAASLAWLGRPSAVPAPATQEVHATDATAPPGATVSMPQNAPAPPPAAAPPEAPATPAAAMPAQPAPAAADSAQSVAAGVTDVQGINPAKPAGVFLLISKEQTVFFRKKRQDSGEGGRVVVPARRTVSVQASEDDQFRIAEGSRVEIYYQGRKLSQKIIDEGSWFRFIPMTAGEEEAKGQAAGG